MKGTFGEKITLKIYGKEMFFTRSELERIVEDYFTIKTNANQENRSYIEGKWFFVDPMSIDRNLFSQERDSVNQEKTRKYILEAFEELDKHPEKYGRGFKTRVLSKEIGIKCSIYLMRDFIIPFGDHIANWVEQCLEWAQRISNGETWQSLCNDFDKSSHFRLVMWKEGYASIGGSKDNNYYEPATHVWILPKMNYDYRYLAPLVVKYL